MFVITMEMNELKQKQHIIVHGYPDVLKNKIPRIPTSIDIDGVGVINPLTGKKTDALIAILNKHGVGYTRATSATMTRVKYLLSGGGITKSVRGKVHGKDVVYTVEADTDREMLDKVDAVQLELDGLGVDYVKVCKWYCETSAIKDQTKQPKKRRGRPPKKDKIEEKISKIEDKIMDIQQENADIKGNPHTRASREAENIMKGILN